MRRIEALGRRPRLVLAPDYKGCNADIEGRENVDSSVDIKHGIRGGHAIGLSGLACRSGVPDPHAVTAGGQEEEILGDTGDIADGLRGVKRVHGVPFGWLLVTVCQIRGRKSSTVTYSLYVSGDSGDGGVHDSGRGSERVRGHGHRVRVEGGDTGLG